jgi:hypothetical protein
VAVRALEINVRDFVIHDFRRTASTHLHEAGFNSDRIEKALAYETKGVRGVYNRAQYADQRREMLQWWATLGAARRERELGDEKNSKLVQEAAAGGLYLETMGVLWLLCGIIFATASNEIAKLIFGAK